MRKGNAIINIISVFGNRSIEYYMIELMKIMFETLILEHGQLIGKGREQRQDSSSRVGVGAEH